MIKAIFSYLIRFIINPSKAAVKIAEDKKALWIGFWWLIIFNFLYSVTVFIFYLLHHTPVETPWLPISSEKWYLFQTFITIPVGVAGYASYCGIVYLSIKATGGKIDFDSILATQSFTLFIPCFILMWIPETLVEPFIILKGINTFPWPEWIENLRVFIIPFAWIIVMSTLALSKISQLPWWRSLIIIIISIIPTGMIMAIFIR